MRESEAWREVAETIERKQSLDGSSGLCQCLDEWQGFTSTELAIAMNERIAEHDDSAATRD